MSKRAFITVLFLLIGLVALSGCTPTCDAGSLEAPDLVSPDWWEVLDATSVSLEWSYPDTSCQPDNFEIILSKDRDFNVIEITELVPGDSTSWTAPTLDVAEEYFWRVRAKVGSTYGPYSHELRSFFTGPYCTAGDLVMPSLVLPAFGGIYDNDYDSLEWSWPLSTCIPESYRVEVSMGSPSFADTTYNGATGNPSTRWGFGSTPPAATQFWWRITPYADGVYGPTSLAKMFWTAPACTAASLVPPVPEQPLDGDTVTLLNPIFAWTYPDSSCTPEGNRLLVSNTPDMSSIVLDANNPTIAARAFQAGVPFADCGEYYWQVSAISEGIEGPPSPVQGFIIDTAGACDCDPTSLPIPDLVSPAPYEIVPDLLPSLQWTNPGSCFPAGFGVDLNEFHDFSGPDLGGGANNPHATSWVPGSPLDPATQYWWRVFSGVGTDFSEPSSQRSFFTGPECSSLAEVVAPVRLAPADGSTVNTLTPALKYTPGEPGCIPDGYLLHLHENADFSDPNLLAEYSLPGTTVITDPLTDCQEYFWSVTAVQDGGYGPESDHGSFFVDAEGACLPPGIPARAIKNNFCRLGTFPEYFDALWTFETGDPALAVARNPFTTYLQLMVLDEKTKQPLEPVILCWSLLNAFEPGWEPPDDQGGRELDFKDLPVVIPPPTPTPTPTPVPTCDYKMDRDSCNAAGGIFHPEKPYCECPK